MNKSHIDKTQEILHDEGFKTILGKTLYEQNGYLAGEDDLRASELMDFFKEAKIIIGFSDITSLLNAIYLKTNTVTFHGPCGYSSWDDFTIQNIKLSLVLGRTFHLKNPSYHKADIKTWAKGKLVDD